MDPREQRLQRLLIPVNIVVIVIAVIAALSILLLPLITVDMGPVVEGMAKAQESEGTGGGSGRDAEWSEAVLDPLKDIKISVTALQFSSFTQTDATEAFSGYFANILRDAMPGIVKGAVIPGMVEEIEERGYDLPDDILETVDADKIYNSLMALEGTEDKDASIDAFIATMEEQLKITITEENKSSVHDSIAEIYDKTVEEAGTFSVEAMVCVSISEAMKEESPDMETFTTFDALFGQVFGSGEGAEAIGQLTDMVSTASMIFFIFMLVCAGVWAVLALMALLRLFLANKRFTMWYVKLIGGFPALFWVGPTLTGSLIPRLVEGAAAESMTLIMSGVTSMMWVVGLCYLLLWAVSLFWAFPIKHKIRAIRKGRA